MFSWQALAVTVFLYWVTICLGISLGYHRLHTHRSYRVPLALEYFFAVCGTLTLEGGPIFWVATHQLLRESSAVSKRRLPHRCVAELTSQVECRPTTMRRQPAHNSRGRPPNASSATPESKGGTQ